MKRVLICKEPIELYFCKLGKGNEVHFKSPSDLTVVRYDYKTGNSSHTPFGSIDSRHIQNELETQGQCFYDICQAENIKNGWINIKCLEPEIGEKVLAFCSSQGTQMCHLGYHNSKITWMMSYDCSVANLNITHWKYLSENPI